MNINTDAKKIEELLTRGVEEIIDRDHLEKRLKLGERLRVKFGIDPTGSQLHLGHSVPLKKLRAFQDLGHTAILLIGDYTATIGDPTGRDTTRPLLSLDDVRENMKTYLQQAERILNMETIEIRYNSEWYEGPALKFFMELTGKVTVARVLDRADFKKRLDEGHDIRMQEILYPLLQGYDSVALNADVELGGSDQTFNLLMGRKLQSRYDQPEQDIMTFPLLEGTDGEKKMSKSYGNYIALMDTPEDMFGKIMSISDTMIVKYFELLTDISLSDIQKMKAAMQAGANPRDYKIALAKELVRLYHSQEDANKAEQYFINTFAKKHIPTDISELKPSAYDIVTVLKEAGFASSNGEARRNIDGGGVKVNEEKVTSYDMRVKAGDVVQKGKRFFVRIV